MNMRQRLLVGATVIILTMSSAWASDNEGHRGRRNWGWGESHENQGHHRGWGDFVAPEIDAASGTSAIALLTGFTLLMKESKRSKRSSKSDE